MSDAVTDTDTAEEADLLATTIKPGQRMAEVEILGRKVRLALPKSQTIAIECTGMLQNSPVRGLGACLAACWQAGAGRGAPKASLTACNYNVGLWGGKVVDELFGRGLTMADLQRAGMVAYNLLIGSLITEQEVKAAEGFSEAPEGSTG